jgi:hypothetical protein
VDILKNKRTNSLIHQGNIMPKKGNYRPFKYKCNEDFFAQDNELSFYWAGFIAADGCVREKKTKYSSIKTFEMALSTKDLAHMELLKKHIEAENPIRICGNKRQNTENCHITISSSRIFDDLNRFGIVPRKSKILQFPDWLARHELVRHFMRGYFDGDGGYYINKKYNNLTMDICGTEQFLTVFKDIMEADNRPQSIAKPYFKNGIYNLNYSGNIQCTAFSAFLYDDCSVYLNRKYVIAKNSSSLIRRKEYVFPTKDELIELYNEMHSTMKIGEKLGLSQQTIANLMIKYDLKYLYKDARLFWNKAVSHARQPLNNEYQKYCPSCKTPKPHCEFGKLVSGILGLRNECKLCAKISRDKFKEKKKQEKLNNLITIEENKNGG